MAIEEKEWQPLGKKSDWTERIGGLYFRLEITDETGTRLDRFVWNTINQFKKILELLRLKYGMSYK